MLCQWVFVVAILILVHGVQCRNKYCHISKTLCIIYEGKHLEKCVFISTDGFVLAAHHRWPIIDTKDVIQDHIKWIYSHHGIINFHFWSRRINCVHITYRNKQQVFVYIVSACEYSLAIFSKIVEISRNITALVELTAYLSNECILTRQHQTSRFTS